MVDSLVPADATQALVLADARHEQALVLADEANGKRRGDWAGQKASKKGKRWGLLADKPFKPLSYVDLPVGLSEAEVDQFLREQRLEDLQRKIRTGQLEDADPDIRSPSPPPIYDREGTRLNTRETRLRKSMLAEYSRLIRYMIKTIEGFIPPPEWRPQRLVKKVIIPYERYPTAPFMGVIIGARGVNHKHLQETTGCKIFVRGRDIGDKFQTDEELQMPQHVHIEGDTEEQITFAEKLILPLLNPETPEFEYARTHGMQQLATVNGFTLKRCEQRCGICSAVGHLAFECPETDSFKYKMANVVCSICGDKGHVASDCKVELERIQRENVDWKAEAEKKAEMDTEYKKMMSELGFETSKNEDEVNEVALVAPQVRTPPPPKPFLPQRPPAPRVPVVDQLALPAVPPLPDSPVRDSTQQQVLPSPSSPAGANGSGPNPEWQSRNRPGLGFRGPPVPRPPPSVAGSQLVPVSFVRAGDVLAPPKPPALAALPKNVCHPSLSQASATVRLLRPQTPLRPQLPLQSKSQPLQQPWRQNSQTAPVILQLGESIDESIACPPHLVPELEGDSSILAEIGLETGARIDLTELISEDERRFRIVGTSEVKEKAKLHVRAWIDVSCDDGTSVPPHFFTRSPPTVFPDGFPPGMPPAGFPPGIPPAGFPPGMPPTGFPPGMHGIHPAGFPPGMPPVGFAPGIPPGMPPGIPQVMQPDLVGGGDTHGPSGKPTGMTQEEFDEL